MFGFFNGRSGGGGGDRGGAEQDSKAERALAAFQAQMRELQELLHDPSISEFCVVTIATALAIAESERLVLALREQALQLCGASTE